MRIGPVPAVSVALLGAVPALAADAPCSKFSWPVDRELALLQASRVDTATGSVLTANAPLALTLVLAKGAALPTPSQKAADPALFAGFATLTVPKQGDYLISLSANSWIDAAQNGHRVDSNAHSGDPNCQGLRKSVRFTLEQGPLTIEISNNPAGRIDVAVTPWYWGAPAPQ